MEHKRLIYGLKEIADAVGVPRKTLAQWKFRNQLPEPTDTTSATPVWLAEVIEPWIEERLRQRQEKTAKTDS